MTHNRRPPGRRPAAALLLAVVLLTATGCTEGSDPMDSAPRKDPATHADPATLQAYLDRIPLPPGSWLVDEQVALRRGDAETTVTRTYRTTGTRPACAQLIDAARGWIIEQDPATPIDPATCDPTGPPDASGDPPGRMGNIRPADTPVAGVLLTWRRDELIFTIGEGDIPSP